MLNICEPVLRERTLLKIEYKILARKERYKIDPTMVVLLPRERKHQSATSAIVKKSIRTSDAFRSVHKDAGSVSSIPIFFSISAI